MSNSDTIELAESTESLPESDRTDQLVRELDAMCRDLVQTVHRLHATNDERMLGRLEERVYTMTDAIHAKQRAAHLDEGINICISHTVDGLPIRVNKVRRMPLWGF